MPTLSFHAALAALFAAAATAVQAQPQAAPAPRPPLTTAECAVYLRESSFARSVADSDAAAFAEHVHAGAVFLGGPIPTRGRDAVVKEWMPIIAGKDAKLRWAADEVVIGTDPRVAFSRGPFVVERLAADAAPRFQLGTFSSVWVLDDDGRWRVMYDGGIGNRSAESREEADRHLARAAVSRCPAR